VLPFFQFHFISLKAKTSTLLLWLNHIHFWERKIQLSLKAAGHKHQLLFHHRSINQCWWLVEEELEREFVPFLVLLMEVPFSNGIHMYSIQCSFSTFFHFFVCADTCYNWIECVYVVKHVGFCSYCLGWYAVLWLQQIQFKRLLGIVPKRTRPNIQHLMKSQPISPYRLFM
jgi:hypothetical protein